MKTRSMVQVAALAAFGSLLLACNGGVEGAYALDKTEMKKSMEAEVAKLPAEQQGFAKLAVTMIDAMDMKLDLKSGGKVEVTSTTPSMEKDKPGKTDVKAGEWRKDGEAIVIKLDKEMTCKPSGKKLTCESGKPGSPSLVFVRS